MDRKGIFFVGSYNHPPNREAIVYFMNEIFQKLSGEIQSLKVDIVGSGWLENSDKIFNDFQIRNQINFLGQVADLKSYCNQKRISIAPLLSGAGIPTKMVDSVSYGVPVIATAKAWDSFFRLEDPMNPVHEGDLIDAINNVYLNENEWKATLSKQTDLFSELFSTTNFQKTLATSVIFTK
jgi:glycosyltransferase involved in cell wall biosynthesis